MTEILDSVHKWKTNLIGSSVLDSKTRKTLTELAKLENRYYHDVLSTTHRYFAQESTK